MKNKKYFLNLVLGIGLGISSGYAQESTNASGGDALGSEGSVAYSIGQVFYTSETGSNGNVNQGVQHTYAIYAVGIDDESTNISLNIFPNPTSGYLTLQLDEYANEKMDYQLINIQGKLLQSEIITNAQTKIDLSTYVKGTYFIQVVRVSKEIKTFKIIKN